MTTESTRKRRRRGKPVPSMSRLIDKPTQRRYISFNVIDENEEAARRYVQYFRRYPDKLVDYYSLNSNFKLFFYQRLFLRGAFRYKYNYITAMRGFAKSFLTILALYLQCILYPGIQVFMCSGTKEQITAIAKDKVREIWDLMPAMKKEVIKEDFTAQGKNYVSLTFRNGSRLDIVAVQNATRGMRRHRGLIDEVIMIDGKKLHEIVLPLMTIDRRTKDGHRDPTENHRSQVYLTTAGYKGTFAYDKLIQSLVWMVVRGNAFVWGGDFRIPIMHGLTSPEIEHELVEDGTYNPESFDREYRGRWSGAVEGAFFEPEVFDKYRVLHKSEAIFQTPKKYSDFYYIFGIDVGRTMAQTALLILKCVQLPDNSYKKQLVNLFVFDDRHFDDQAIEIKRQAYNFNPRIIAFDVKGIGRGLLDYMVKESHDTITGEVFMPYVPYNLPEYNEYQTNKSENIIHAIKGDPEVNANIYSNMLNQFNSGKIQMLIDDKIAKDNLMATEEGRRMSGEEKAMALRPFILTSILKDEMMNMQQKLEGNTLKLVRVNTNKTNDKFMALGYALWGAKVIEDKLVKEKKKRSARDFMFFN